MLLWAASGCALMAQAPRPMTLVDIINLPQVSDPQLSPDGRQIVFVESVANWKADKRIGHVWRVNADGSGLAQMTSGTDGENSPRWSPDGKTIAFIAKRGAEPDAVAQIFLHLRLPAVKRGRSPRTRPRFPTSSGRPTAPPIYFRAADPKSDEQKAREKLKDDVFMFDERLRAAAPVERGGRRRGRASHHAGRVFRAGLPPVAGRQEDRVPSRARRR